MAVVGLAVLRPTSGSGEFEAGKYVLREVYRVVTDSLADDGTVVITAAGLPKLFQGYRGIQAMRARRFTPKRILDKVWEVEVEWSTPERKEGSGGEGGDKPGGTGTEKDGQFEDPTLELPTVKFDVASREVLITQVVDSVTGALKPPTSSNGEAYDPPPKRSKNFATMEITQNEPITANHPALGIQYVNAVNNDIFWGMSPGVWQCKKISADLQVRQLPGGLSFPYLKVTYSFEATDSWDIVLLDYGTYYLRANPGGATTLQARTEPFTTSRGTNTAGALNGQGGPLVMNLPCSFAANSCTVVVGSSGVTFALNDIVTFSNVGGALPTGLLPGVAYYVRAVLANVFTLGTTRNSANPIIFGAGTGQSYISQPAVYNTIRPYPWLPFAALNLPQSFAEVQ